MIRVPNIIDVKNPLIAQIRVLPFNVYCNPQEANAADRDEIIFGKLKEIEQKVTRNGFVTKIGKIVRINPGKVITRTFSGYVQYTVWCTCRTYNAETGDVIMNCRVKAKEDGMLSLQPADNLMVIIPEIHLTTDLYEKINIGDFYNIECVSVDSFLWTSDIILTGKIARKIYDIPIEMRQLDMSINAGEIVSNVKLEMFDGKADVFLPQLGYIPAEIPDDVWKVWEKRYKYLLNPYELLEGRKTYVPQKLDIKELIYDKFPYKMTELPVSRAYFKIVEIVYRFGFDKFIDEGTLLVSLADAPGGFAQALSHIFPGNPVMTTSIKEASGEQIPYSPVIVKKKSIKIDYLATGTGNLTAVENIRYLGKKYGEKAGIVACDGAFDHDSYPGIEKEVLHHQLLFAEIIAGLSILARKGCACWKMYTRFTDVSIRLIHWIAQFFEKCYIYKPRSVRMANSESFIVCTGFYGLGDFPIEKMYGILAEMGTQVHYDQFVRNLFTNPVPDYVIDRVKNFNIYLQNWQTFVFNMAMSLMKHGEKKEDYLAEQFEYASRFLKWTDEE